MGLEIGLMVSHREITDSTDFMCNITRIVTVLNLSDIKEWIVNVEAYKWSGHFQYESNGLGAAIVDFLSTAGDFGVHLMERTRYRFIIGNRGCRMIPHHQKWN